MMANGKWHFIYIYVHNDIDVKLSYQLYDAGKHLPSMYLIWSVSLCILLYVNVLYYGTINDGTCCGTYVYIYMYICIMVCCGNWWQMMEIVLYTMGKHMCMYYCIILLYNHPNIIVCYHVWHVYIFLNMWTYRDKHIINMYDGKWW